MDGATVQASGLACVLVQARIFEAIAGVDILTGHPHDLARQFDVVPSDFLACLDELVAVGWVTAETDSDGRLRLRLQD